jgi:phosphoribosylglycinamide formyltransferase-1
MNKFQIGVLASGQGTNLQAIIDAVEAGAVNGEIAVIISNVKDAFCLERAKKHNIPGVFIDHKAFPDRESFDKVVAEELDRRGVTLVVLAGFMRILSGWFVTHFPNRIINIHPALLPAFKGLYGHNVHEAVVASGTKFSGCTVHFVTEDVDGGPIIIQAAVPVLDDDTADTLAARVLEQEHKIYPEAVKLFGENKLLVDGKRVKFRKEQQ